MEDLIAEIRDKTGLPTEKVLEVVTMVTDFMRQQLPDDLVQSITAYLGDAAGLAGGAAAGTVDKVVGTAAAVFSKAVDTVNDVVASESNE